MTSNIDIYQTANELIKQHGDNAPTRLIIPAIVALAIVGTAGMGCE